MSGKRSLLVWPAVVVFAIACGDGGGSSSGGDGAASSRGGTGGGAVGGGARGGTPSGGGAPVPGPSASGWQQAYVDGSARIHCDMSPTDLEGSGAPHLSLDGSTAYVGYEQVGDNQNPIVARVDGASLVFCQRHETEGPDGRAWGITWDGGQAAYVVYTIVGGGTALEGKGGWLSSYAPGAISGGGAKVSYVGRVDMTDGTLTSGTFVIAVKSDNSVNSHGPRGPVTVLEDGSVEFLGGSAHKPIDVDRAPMDCTDYPFDSKYVLSADLSEVLCAECTNCTSQSPCD